jgi:membrane associated rhomboid family serine protease
MTITYSEIFSPDGDRPQSPGDTSRRQTPEPLVNAPWPVVVLTVGIIIAYLVQSRFPLEAISAAFGFSPAGLLQGHPERLLTSLFVHGNWAHALMNAAFILAFGAPVARFFGPRPGGALDFFLFYLVCGILACLGFAGLHWGQEASLIGASGAASGLMGAAARLIGGNGRVGPLFSRAVTGMGLGWLIINIIMALAGGLAVPGAGEGAVGWEAHLAGFVVGVLLIGPFGWATGRR